MAEEWGIGQSSEDEKAGKKKGVNKPVIRGKRIKKGEEGVMCLRVQLKRGILDG